MDFRRRKSAKNRVVLYSHFIENIDWLGFRGKTTICYIVNFLYFDIDIVGNDLIEWYKKEIWFRALERNAR